MYLVGLLTLEQMERVFVQVTAVHARVVINKWIVLESSPTYKYFLGSNTPMFGGCIVTSLKDQTT